MTVKHISELPDSFVLCGKGYHHFLDERFGRQYCRLGKGDEHMLNTLVLSTLKFLLKVPYNLQRILTADTDLLHQFHQQSPCQFADTGIPA